MSKKPETTCSACGTSPVNHRLLFISNLLEETLGKAGDKLLGFNKNKANKTLANFVERCLFIFLAFIGFVRYDKDIEKAPNGRSKLIWEEAKQRGIEMEQVVVWGKCTDHYRARINGQIFHFESLPIPPWLNQGGYEWLDDKFTLFRKLAENGIPVPASKKISTLKNALNVFEALEKPLIVKPKFGSRGRHTTTNINTKEDLKNAFDLAFQITPYMVIQEHLQGSVYRATVINNKLVGFFRGDPPVVVGDGVKSIALLIEEKNASQGEKLSPILINEELISFILRQDYTLESVPPKGTALNLLAKTGRMYGGYTEEMLEKVHPKMHSIFKKAGELVEAPVVGFDLIIPNPQGDPDTQRWGIIECNSLPFIDLHYFALEGPQTNLAKNVWDLWELS